MKLITWFKENSLLLVVLLFASVLRIYHIDFQSLWMDEVNTVNETNPNYSASEVYQALLNTDFASPPLYFFIIHFVFKIFGYTTFVLRMVSAVYGIAAVWMIYILGKEIFNKRAGIFAAVLLAINCFHVHYSQEARFYAFLTLVTIVSFYGLVCFLKKPSVRTAVFYGVSAALMLYGHFFAMFSLCAQYLILLVFLIRPFYISRIKFFLYCFLSAVVTAIVFLPFSYDFLIKTSQVKSTYIKQADIDFFSELFKEFFGKSEMVMFFVVALLILFFVKLFMEKNENRVQLDPIKDKIVFASFILFVWTFITILLPLIRSHTTVPMLQYRYLIGILPPIIIIAAIGLSCIESKTVQNLILSSIVIFSVNDLFIVKKYYSLLRKDQFREVCAFVNKNNLKNNRIISNRSWYLTYFLEEGKGKTKLSDMTLEDLANELMKDSSKKDFWYVGAGEEVRKISEKAQKYLDDNYEIENNCEYIALWARHYKCLTDKMTKIPEIDISNFKPLKDRKTADFQSYIDSFDFKDGELNCSGFSYYPDINSEATRIKIVLAGTQKAYKLQTLNVPRHDVTTYINGPYNLDNSGFKTKLDLSGLPPGTYELVLWMKNEKLNKESMALCGKSLIIQ